MFRLSGGLRHSRFDQAGPGGKSARDVLPGRFARVWTLALLALTLPAQAGAQQQGVASLAGPGLVWRPVLTLVLLLVCLAQAGCLVALWRQRRRMLWERKAGCACDLTYRFLVEHAQEAICTVDLAGLFTYANPCTGALLGLPAERLTGKSCLEFVKDEDRPTAKAYFDRVRAGENLQYEGRYKAAGGNEGWMLVSAIPLRDASGAVTGAFIVAHDLTVRKHSELARKESEARYRALIQLAPEAIVVYDPDSGRFTDANGNAQRLFGLTLEEFCASAPARLYQEVQPDNRPLDESVAENIRRTLAGESLVLERAVRDTRGRLFACELRLAILPSAKRRLVRASFVDITERKRAEEALRLSEHRFKSLYEQAADGILVFGPDGRLTAANPAARELLGYDLEEFLGKTYADLLEPGQLDAQPVDMAALRDGRTVRGERVFLRRDGRSVPTDVSARLVDDECFQVLIKDVEARKNLEKLREDVDRIIRHDLKTPLVSIQSLALQIGKGSLPDRARERLEMLADSAQRMMRMINFSLDLYKMETKTFELVPVEFDLLRSALHVTSQMRPLAKGRKVDLVVLFDGSEPDAQARFPVRGEELLCLGLLENLVQNAVEASPREARVSILLETNPRRLVIRNRGEVPEAIRRTFFDKYVTSGKAWGTGLGTYSAWMVAEAHGWTIALDCSAPGWTGVGVTMGPDTAGSA
ncbi:hypothetical protein JCM15519_20330 [Fundidesulfovibrio butyratiphilus]